MNNPGLFQSWNRSRRRHCRRRRRRRRFGGDHNNNNSDEDDANTHTTRRLVVEFVPYKTQKDLKSGDNGATIQFD